MTYLPLYLLFQQAVFLSFSGFATVPALRTDLVLNQHVLTDLQLNDAIAISQASPGPLGIYVVIVGYFVAGLPGAAAGVLALALPSFLAIPIAQLVQRGRSAALQGACTGIVIAASSLMIVSGLQLAPRAAASAPLLAAIVVGSVLLVVTKMKPVWVIAGGALVGLVTL